MCPRGGRGGGGRGARAEKVEVEGEERKRVLRVARSWRVLTLSSVRLYQTIRLKLLVYEALRYLCMRP